MTRTTAGHAIDRSRRVLPRLSVFETPFTPEAAAAVGADEAIDAGAVGGILEDLLATSSLVEEPRAAATDDQRYRLADVARAAASRELEAGPEGATVRQRHRDYFLDRVERLEPVLYEADQAAWLDVLEAEHEDLRAAFDFSVATGDGAAAVRLAAAMGRFWHMHGHLAEARERTARALTLAGSTASAAARTRAIDWAATFARYQGDLPAARSAFDEVLALQRSLGNELGAARTLHSLGLVARAGGDDELGGKLLETALADLRRLGSDRDVHNALHNLGDLAADRGDVARARALHLESLAIRRRVGAAVGIAASNLSLGTIALAVGDPATARSHFVDSVAGFAELGDEGGIAEGLRGLAAVASEARDADRTARLLGAAEAIDRRLGTVAMPSARRATARLVRWTRRRMGAAPFAAARRAGRAMATADAIAYASEPAAG